MLWYLRLCSDNGIIVTDYVDRATGTMEETADGSGRFKEVTLHPIVTITDKAGTDKARSLHQEASRMCFIANSCNFPIKHLLFLRPLSRYFRYRNCRSLILEAISDESQHIGNLLVTQEIVGGHDVAVNFAVDWLMGVEAIE